MRERGIALKSVSLRPKTVLLTPMWRTGCGSHLHSAEVVEALEESVWSVVRQENERENQGEGVQYSGKTGTGIRSRDMYGH